MPQLVEFEGAQHEFPDDFSEDEISEALTSYQPQGVTETTEESHPPGLAGSIPAPATPDRSFTGSIRQAMDQPLEAMGVTAEVFGMPRVGAALRGVVEKPDAFQPATERFFSPKPGDPNIAGFNLTEMPRALVEQFGQVVGSVAMRAVGTFLGGAAGGRVAGPKGAAVGAAAGGFAGPFLFEAMQIAGPVAMERARRNGRAEPSVVDITAALTTAAGSGALNAVGARYLPGGAGATKNIMARIVKAMIAEGSTEGGQAIAEQVGESAGTETGLEIRPREALGEALLGAGAGGAISAIPMPAQKPTVESVQRSTDAELETVKAEAEQMAAPQAEAEALPVAAPEPTVETTGAPEIAAAERTPAEAPAPPAAGMSQGPGAAAATEPLVSYEKRRFGERFQEDKAIDPAIREATGNQYYEPIPNVATVKEAETIIERRGTDESVRLVRDESFPMDHRVRSTMAQGLIKKLNQSYAEATKAGDTKAAEGFLTQAADTAEYLSELGTKLGQGVQSFAIWSRLTPEGMLMAAKRTIRKARAKAGPEGEIPKDLDPAELAELTRMAAEIENTPEGFQRNEKMVDFLGKIADLNGVDPADIPTALWYANILSGYSTQLVNTVDTGLNVFSEAAAMAASHPSAVPDILSGLYRGLLKGGLEAKETLRTGRGRTESKLQIDPVLERTRFGQKGGVPISTDTAFGRVLKAGFEKKPAKILNLWKYPLRAMVASDTVFYNSFKEARSRVLARAMAKKEGLSGDALFRRVDEILNQTPEKIAQAQEQATAEGLTGARYKRRVREIQEQGRPEDLVSNADEAAQIATYNHDPTGTLGVIASKIGEITQNVPLARAIVPFTRIVANVANRGLDYTPWGYKRLFFGQHGGERFATKPPVDEAYRTQLIKATAGTIGMAVLAALDAEDVIQLTASGPQNPDERKQLQNSGWKPYSVKVGDTWISYQYTPLNLGLAMMGHYRDAIRYNKLDEKDAQTRLAYGMLKAGSTLFDMSFLSGLSGFMETMSGATSSSKAAGRMLARTASSVVIPNLFKQLDRLFDPTLYDAATVQQMLIRETPVARSLTLEPMLNVLGEPIRMSNNRFFSFDKDDPVWKLIVEKQAFVPVPSKTRKVGKRAITPREYRELIEVSGKEIRSYIQNNLATLQTSTPEEAQKKVDAASTSAREKAMNRFSEANPKK